MFRMNGMPRAQGCAGAACVSIALHMGKVRPGTGQETGLGHERYIAIEHKMCDAIVSMSHTLKKSVNYF